MVLVRGKEPQVPPLRPFGAPVGMTILSRGSKNCCRAFAGTPELSSRPELQRSVVEGPAVLSPVTHNSLKNRGSSRLVTVGLPLYKQGQLVLRPIRPTGRHRRWLSSLRGYRL
jgi:hypothetical protein